MMGATNEFWWVEPTSTCFIIVTIVEIHSLIIDVSVSKQNNFSNFWSEQILRNIWDYIGSVENHLK